jgi:hypothetical protein
VKRFLGGLGALGVLAAIWAVLIVVGLVAGAFPPIRPAGMAPHEAGSPLDAGIATRGTPPATPGVDAGTRTTPETPPTDAAAGTTVPEPPETIAISADSGAGEADAATPFDARTAAVRTVVCEADAVRPGLALAQLVGDARPEVVVLCGRTVLVLGADTRDDDAAPRFAQIARFERSAQGTEPDATLVARSAGAGDVDADGQTDLVLGFADPSERARNGAIFLVAREPGGGFTRPRSLGALHTVALAVLPLDVRTGAEILAVHRAQAASRRPSELWVFGGGAAPGRVAQVRVGVGAEALALADLDRDTHPDALVVTSDGPRVDVLFGDGATSFPRSAQLAVQGAREAVAADVDGDGVLEVVLGGETTTVVRPAASPAPIELLAIEAARGLRLLAAGDRAPDGAREIVGYMHPDLVALSGLTTPTPTRRTLRVLHDGEPMPVALAVGDVDADGRADVVTLARVRGDAPYELVVMPTGQVPFAPASTPLRDAPLSLRIALR